MLRSGWFVFSLLGRREQENASASNTMTDGRIIFCKWRLVCRGRLAVRIELLRTRDLLLAKVSFFDPGVAGQVLRRTFHHYSSRFQNVCAIGMFQSRVCVLFDQQNRRTF